VRSPWVLAFLGIVSLGAAFAFRRYGFITRLERASNQALPIGMRVMKGLIFWTLVVCGVGLLIGGLILVAS
jgi:hypothetical protein